MKGWVTPEEWLYPQAQEALSAWTIGHRSSHVVYRIVGEQWAPRSHELRDTLTRNSAPFDFYAADSQAGRQLIREFSIDVRRLPAVIHYDGSSAARSWLRRRCRLPRNPDPGLARGL